jgi:UDP-N-acetylmuramoyl-tripeptide--D-alanyl-D-alanine ligase
MKTWSPSLWALWTEGVWRGTPPQSITGISLDSRRIREGEGFVALRTDTRDGHDFLQEVRDKGASFALVESGRSIEGLPCLEVRNPRYALSILGKEIRNAFSGVVIGVSGSCGKTSTKEILAILLGERAYKTPGNLNNDLGLPLSLLPLNNEDHDYAVLEVGISRVGEMEPLTDILQPDYALITCVAPSHLEGMGSLENVAEEKSILLRSLRDPSHAYFPANCTHYQAYMDIAGWQIATTNESIARGSRATVRRYHREINGKTTLLSLEPDTDTCYALASAGPGMASNAVLALCLALDLGISPSDLQQRLALWKPSSMRAQWKQRNGYPVLVDCYNSNPASLREAGELFHQWTQHYGNRLWVLGGMKELGSNTADWHKKVMDELPIQLGDTVLGVGEEAIFFQEAVEKRGGRVNWLFAKEAEEGVQWVEDFTGPILFKGSRGHALEKMLPTGLIDSEIKETEKLC